MIERNGRLIIFDNFKMLERPKPKNKKFDGSLFLMSDDNTEPKSPFYSSQKHNIPRFINNIIEKINRKKHFWLFNPLKFFKSIKLSRRYLEPNQNRIKTIESIIQEARLTHQTALVEKLEDGKDVIIREVKLANAGISQYLEEDDVIKVCQTQSGSRDICLDWISNFIRIIPVEVRDKMQVIEKDQLCDNYVIMHYDPKSRNSAETKKEIIKRKDPILFGVLRNSRRLYYIADWIDEYCDLTFNDVLTKLNLHPESRELTINAILQSETMNEDDIADEESD